MVARAVDALMVSTLNSGHQAAVQNQLHLSSCPLTCPRSPAASRNCRKSQNAQPGQRIPLVAICAIDGMAGIGKTTFAIHWGPPRGEAL
jgi:hypothetical protein